MLNKKILIVTRSFYPNTWPRAFRATELAKEFSRQGHEVTVITPKVPEHLEFEKLHNVIIKDLGSLKWKGFSESGKGLGLLIKKVINRLLNWLFEFPNIKFVRLVAKALSKERGYDLLLSIAHPYPIHWGVAKVWSKDPKKNPAKVWIADCGDPYMNQDNAGLLPPFYFAWVEKWFMRKADFITVPIREALEGYFKEFHHKIKVIPQGFRFQDVSLYKGDLSKNKVLFGYAGNFIPGKRDPSEFLEFLNGLDSKYNFEFRIYTHNPFLVTRYAENSNGRIKLMPVLPRNKVLYELSKMHFVVNFENFGTKQLPSKLIDYAILKKPILSIKTGSLDKEMVLEFLSGDYKSQMIVNNPDQYRIETVTKQFLELSNS